MEPHRLSQSKESSVQAHPLSGAGQEATHPHRGFHWKGGSLYHVQGLHPYTFHPPLISQMEKTEVNKETNAALPHLLSLATPAAPPVSLRAPDLG